LSNTKGVSSLLVGMADRDHDSERSDDESRSRSRSSDESDRSRSSGERDESRDRSDRSGSPYRDDHSEEGSRYSEGNRGENDDEEYTEDETDHFSDESENEHYSDEDEERERDIHRNVFSNLPQPKLVDDNRLIQDEFASGLLENIKHLQGHVIDIQKREVAKMNAYAQALNPGADSKDEEAEAKKFKQALADIRDERKKYRGLLYDALKERDELIESREIFKIEDRATKNKADTIDKYNGLDITLLFAFGIQVGITVLYIIFMDFQDNSQLSVPGVYGWQNNVDYVYVFLIDISMMVFLGFTLQRAHLRKYAYSAIGGSLLVGAIGFQFGILWNGFFDWSAISLDSKIYLDMASLITGLYCATTVIVGYGAVVGRCNTAQTVTFAFFAAGFYSLNYYITIGKIQGYDLGGAITIHLFGSLFGVGASWIIGLFDSTSYTALGQDQRSSYQNDVFSFLGTLVLFILFPSFNGAFAANGAQFRVVINTALACTSSGAVVVALDWFFGFQKWRPFILQQGVMAGGIVMGCAHSELVPTYVAILLGGIISGPCVWIGLRFVTPLMNKAYSVPSGLSERLTFIPRDTAGVLISHGVPGFIGAIAGISATADYKNDYQFGQNAPDLFPLDPYNQAPDLASTWAISMGIGLGGGLFTGLLMLAWRRILPSEHLPTRRNALPALKDRPFHDEASWRDIPAEID